MNLVPSQEPAAPVLPDAGGGRTRGQTRRTKLVEETQQHEILPSGDDLEIRQVRSVSEVAKRVAVVKRGARATDHEEAELEEEEEAPAQPRRSGRRGTAARLEEELGAAMQQDIGAGGPSAAPSRVPPGADVRRYQQVTIEGDGAPPGAEEEAEEEAESDEGIAAEEPPSEMHRAEAQPRRGGGRRQKAAAASEMERFAAIRAMARRIGTWSAAAPAVSVISYKIP